MDLDGAGAERGPAVGGIVVEPHRVEFGALDLGRGACTDDAKGADPAFTLVNFSAQLLLAGKGAEPGGEFVGEAREGVIGGGMMAGSRQGVDP